MTPRQQKQKPCKPNQGTETVGTKSADALWAAIAQESAEQEPPPGSMSARQYSERFGVGLNTARNTLSRLVDQKRATATPVRRMVCGQMRESLYYSLIQ